MQQSAVPIHEVPPTWFTWVTYGLIVYGFVAVASLAAIYVMQLVNKRSE